MSGAGGIFADINLSGVEHLFSAEKLCLSLALGVGLHGGTTPSQRTGGHSDP